MSDSDSDSDHEEGFTRFHPLAQIYIDWMFELIMEEEEDLRKLLGKSYDFFMRSRQQLVARLMYTN